MLTINRLIWDDWNVEHIVRHEVWPDEVEDVCQGDFVVLVGKKSRLVIIGPTSANRMLAVVLHLHPAGEGVYYPVTARPAARKERRIYKQMKGGGVI